MHFEEGGGDLVENSRLITRLLLWSSTRKPVLAAWHCATGRGSSAAPSALPHWLGSGPEVLWQVETVELFWALCVVHLYNPVQQRSARCSRPLPARASAASPYLQAPRAARGLFATVEEVSGREH